MQFLGLTYPCIKQDNNLFMLSKGSVMKKIILTIFTLFTLSNYAQSQTLVAMPKNDLDSNIPLPVAIEILDPDRSNFELIIKVGGREVNNILVSGNINIDKLGTRFRIVDPNVSVITTIKNKKSVEEKITLKLKSAAVEPIDLAEEKVQIGGRQFTFQQKNSETMAVLNDKVFKFFIKSTQSKNSYIKKVVVELTKGDQKSLVTINTTSLWWNPYFSIEGAFDKAVIKDISFN